MFFFFVVVVLSDASIAVRHSSHLVEEERTSCDNSHNITLTIRDIAIHRYTVEPQ